MEKQQQNQNTKSVKITRNIALPMLIITVISLSTLIICTLIAVGVIIANSIQTKEQWPEWLLQFASVYSIIALILVFAMLVLSIVLFIFLCKNKQLTSMFIVTCALNWAFGLFVFIINVLTAANVNINDSARQAFALINIMFLIVLVVLDSITYTKLNKQYKLEKK